MAKLKKLIFVNMFVACMLLFGFCLEVKASYYEINTSVGFDGGAKHGRYIPVKLDIYSEESFEGTLSIQVEYESGNIEVVSYPLTIPENDAVLFQTYIPFFVKNTDIKFVLKNLEGEVVKSKIATIETLEEDYTELFVGVLCQRRIYANLFDNINIGEYTDTAFPYIFTNSFMLKASDIWGETRYTLDCIDVIVVMADSISTLSKEQIDMLLAWVESGKTLIVEYDEMLAADLFGELYDMVISEQKNEDELRPGFWVTAANYGSGRISFMSGATDKDLYSYTDDVEILGKSMGKSLTLEMVDEIVNYDLYYDNYDNSYDVQYMLNSVQGKEKPNIMEYIIIVVVYIIVVGPILYCVLRLLKKISYVFICVVVLMVIFSYAIYDMGSNTRFSEMFLQYATIVEIGKEDIEEKVFFSINTPYSDTYYLKFNPQYTVKTLLATGEAIDEQGDYVEILYGEGTTRTTIKKNVPFSKEYFEADRLIEDKSKWNIDVQVTYYDGILTGHIINNTGKTLKNTALLLYDKLVMVGNIEAGQSVNIDLLNTAILPYYAGDVADMVVRNSQTSENDKEDDVTKAEQEGMVEYLISSYFDSKKTDSLFIGFAEGVEQELQIGTPCEAYGSTMFCKDIDVNLTIGSIAYEPVNYKDVVSMDSSTNYDAYSNTTYGSRARLQYNFTDKESIARIVFDIPESKKTGNNDYYGIFDGEVLFYNNVTLEYDEININQEYFDIIDIADYLKETEDGYTLIVQYNIETKGKYRYTEIKMPTVSVMRRIGYAQSDEFEEEIR
ncbi:MAG: hypothetical protein IJW18_05145 [Lachnospiraceae bacterium]|nr:hypothetical protein [Lachnospiraceae bacterium]